MQTRILMICLGNICRSPLAEGIFKSKLPSEQYFIDSAGTAGYHIGELPDIRSIEIAKHHNIDITNQRCRKFTTDDFEDFDYIFAMDSSNYNNIIALAKTEEDKAKVQMILNLTDPGKNKEVPDPYYGGKDGFEKVYQMLNDAANSFLKKQV